jgi:hypothetical protein
MSKIEWKNLSINTRWSDLSPNKIARRSNSYEKTSASAPTSTHVGRRKNNLRASLRAFSNIGSQASPVNMIRRDCIAWQLVSQQLTLQLEQKHRAELAARCNRSRLLGEEHKDHVNVLIDKAQDLKMSPTTAKGKSTYIHSGCQSSLP